MESKSALRARMAAVRDAIAADARRAKSEIIARRLGDWEAFARAKVVFAFLSTRSEVLTEPIIAAALAAGKVVATPRALLAERRLEFRRIRDATSGRVPGAFGISEPAPDAPLVEPAAADIILVPGLAFDPRGYRIGYGGGFYDRLLAAVRAAGGAGRKPTAVGVAFEEQMVERVPDSERDQPVDWIVTDRRRTDCAAGD